jgi:hypothetical protein
LGYTPDEIKNLVSQLKRMGKKKVADNLNMLLASGADHDTLIAISNIINRLNLQKIDPSIINTIKTLLTTDMGEDQKFSEDQAYQFVLNLTNIYGANNTDAIANATTKILEYNLNLERTIAINNSLKALFQDELNNRNSKYYAGSPAAAVQSITNIVNGLSFKNINARPFDRKSLQDHATKHMAEVGANSPQDYQQKAMNFMNGDPNEDEIELQRPNGEIVRYNLKTHEIGIVYGDGPDAGKLITYFKVNKGSDKADLNYALSQVYKQDR